MQPVKRFLRGISIKKAGCRRRQCVEQAFFQTCSAPNVARYASCIDEQRNQAGSEDIHFFAQIERSEKSATNRTADTKKTSQ